MTASLLEIRNLSKTFPGQRALRNVDLDVRPGEVVALLGENGSGKSTLVKILSGYYRADPGCELRLHGDQLVPGSMEARQHLRFVHQQSTLIDELTVVENFFLGRAFPRRGLRIDWKRAAAEATDRLARFGFTRSVRTPVAKLTPADQAIVAIARAIEGWDSRGGVLVLDEPTAFLHSREVDRMLEAVRVVASEGAGVILITHRMDDVFAVADRAFILRDGSIVAVSEMDKSSEDELILAITGRPRLSDTASSVSRLTPDARVVLSVAGLRRLPLRDLSFEVRVGEVLGVTGTIGSGQETLSRSLFGVLVPEAGEIRLDGVRVHFTKPKQAIDAGVAYVPSDRAREGCILSLNVRENTTLARLEDVTQGKVFLSRAREGAVVEFWRERFRLTPGSNDRPMALLSGGNQQKVVLAKWLQTSPRLFLLDEPTNGVDVAAKVAIMETVRDTVRAGAAAIVCSIDAVELARHCDRVIVLSEGVVVAELEGDEMTSEAITAASYRTLGAESCGAKLD